MRKNTMRTIQEISTYYGSRLAGYALDAGAIRLSPRVPFRWASGYHMPIYNDNRQLLAYPTVRKLVSNAFADFLEALNFDPDVISGTATAGIPHATTLADALGKPLSYVRSGGKGHGLQHQIEGLGEDGSFHQRQVLLIEDLISTGGSSLRAVQAVRDADGVCPYVFALFTYGLEAAGEAFQVMTPACKLYTLLTYSTLLAVASEQGYVDEADCTLLQEWSADPFGWGAAHGFERSTK